MNSQSVSHAIYDCQYTFNGKKMYKTDWLRRKFPLLYPEEQILKGNDARAFLDALIKDN